MIRILFACVYIVAVLGLSSYGQSPQVPASVTRCSVEGGAKRNAETFRRWVDDAWHQGRIDLVKDLVGKSYVRHEAAGTRTVTPEQYAKEIGAARKRMPDIRFLIHECTAIGDRLWTRWTMVATDPNNGTKISRMGTQIYRLEKGRLVETWMLTYPTHSAWPEAGGIEKTVDALPQNSK